MITSDNTTSETFSNENVKQSCPFRTRVKVPFFCTDTLKYKALLEVKKQTTQIRRLLLMFIVVLFLSGLTAIPVDMELSFLLQIVPEGDVYNWLDKVLVAYRDVDSKYPFLLYGYDWLAFAHFVLAILFIGPYRNPVKNIWVIEFGMIACVLIIPLAFIAGHFRGIPLGWRLIDCSFGIIGILPLWICYRKIKIIEKEAV